MGLRTKGTFNCAFKRDMKGNLYKDFLRYSLEHCSEGLVMVRPHLSLSENARSVLTRLAPFRIEAPAAVPWIGAQIFDSRAEMWRFRFVPESLALILEVSSHLYQWEQPELPEDLALFRPDGTDWLVVMAHSRRAYVSVSREERAQLVAAVPKMGGILQ
jgi:hypothetical protein